MRAIRALRGIRANYPVGMFRSSSVNWRVGALAIVVGGAALLVPSESVFAQRCATCAAEDTTRHIHVLPALGLRVGTPQKASFAVGVVVGEDWQQNQHDHSRNIALYAEPGLSAGRGSVAYVHHGYGSFGSGFGVAGTVLRTWQDPWGAKDNLTYAGGELIFWPVVFVGPRVGLFRSISGGTGRWFASIDIGIGL
jgi:hypothetical protein